MRRSLIVLFGVLVLAFGSATPGEAGATVQKGTVDFGATPGVCMFFADVALGVCGSGGTVDYHIVLTPSGNENSHFDVNGFTGCVTLTGTLAGCIPAFTFAAPVSALVLIHLGDQPGKPFALVNHGPAGVPHRIALP